MELEIRPQPSEEQRAAIAAALAEEASEEHPPEWAQAVLPQQDSTNEA